MQIWQLETLLRGMVSGERAGADGDGDEAEADDVEPGADNDPVTVP
jgi:hypothetical protein